VRREGGRRDGPLRGRGDGQRADHPAGGVRASLPSRHRGDARGGDRRDRGALPRGRAPAAAASGAADRCRSCVDRPGRSAAGAGGVGWLTWGSPPRESWRRARCGSVKRGLVDFARGLANLGVEIVSTGGTARELAADGIETRPVEDYTGFPEILDGRVKT